MARDRVELISTLIQRWNAGERETDDFVDFFDPDFEMESPLSSVSGEPYRGYVGLEQWVRDLDEQFAEWSITPDGVRQIADSVLIFSSIRARGRTSHATLQFPSAAVADFGSDDRVTRIRIYADVDEARKAVGLER
jgi:SnoaL-like domain